ncbi:MAG: chromate efflux transporter [Bryobacteraceae bacterium]
MSVLERTEKPPFREALLYWCTLGWISFGGTAAHIALMHDALVERKKWISNSSFLHALSHCMILPGPEAQQLAIYIGWKLHGKKGGLVAGTLFVLPSMFVILALSLIYVQFGNLPWISAMFNGLKPAVIALIILAFYRVAQRALHGALPWTIAVAAFTGMFFLHVSLPLIMLAVVILGVALGAMRPSLLHSPSEPGIESEAADDLTDGELPNAQSRLVRPLVKLTGIALLLWLAPLPFFVFSGDFSFWKTLVLLFTKTAFVTVGGSYTVIPYVAQVAVSKLHWLSEVQMMDGFALAETTPGPLIIVVAFVGFMAAYNHFHGSLWMGTLGLLATSFYTFLPCFLFVFAGAPLVERTSGKPIVKGVLGLITAVVVGAMLELTLFLGKGVLFPAGLALPNLNVISLLWVIGSIVLIKRFGLNIAYLILLSIAFGALRYQVRLHLR